MGLEPNRKYFQNYFSVLKNRLIFQVNFIKNAQKSVARKAWRQRHKRAINDTLQRLKRVARCGFTLPLRIQLLLHRNILNGNSWLATQWSHTDVCRGAIIARGKNEHFSLRAKILALGCCIALAMVGGELAGDAVAQDQPEFEIQTNQPNLEQEYRDELDKWMLRAYEGDRDAQFKVGVLFTNDQFGPPDFEQAVYWYKQAARQGHVLAQYNLGHQYLTGVGVEKSDASAMEWWLKAADQDHALAQFNVGRAYYLGIGLKEDHSESKYWFERAAANQEPKSIDILKQLGWYDSAAIASRVPTAPTEPTTASLPSAGPVNAAGQDIYATSTANGDSSGLTSKIVPIAGEPAPVQRAPKVTASPAPTSSTTVVQNSTPTTQAAAAEAEPVTAKDPIALYTDPSVRSVLIAILDERDALLEVGRDTNWVTVQSTSGFPVWVHGDFLNVSGDTGTITGQAVNARSVPIITNGTVVGKLDKDEFVAILDERKGWYRVVAPPRFKAWAKVADMDREVLVAEREPAPSAEDAAPASDSAPATESAVASGEKPINDNEWMFNQPTARYTLQLASFDDLAKVEEFESRAKFADNPELHRFTSKGKNIEWTYFLYGSYATREEAEAAKLEINQKLAWVRSFGRLQENRCVAWKTQLPTPQELNRYCIGD